MIVDQGTLRLERSLWQSRRGCVFLNPPADVVTLLLLLLLLLFWFFCVRKPTSRCDHVVMSTTKHCSYVESVPSVQFWNLIRDCDAAAEICYSCQSYAYSIHEYVDADEILIHNSKNGHIFLSKMARNDHIWGQEWVKKLEFINKFTI